MIRSLRHFRGEARARREVFLISTRRLWRRVGDLLCTDRGRNLPSAGNLEYEFRGLTIS
jgi:hypothetical protein